MKNKKWKRQAKRLKGKATLDEWCILCVLKDYNCHVACSVGIRELEKIIKINNKFKCKQQSKIV